MLFATYPEPASRPDTSAAENPQADYLWVDTAMGGVNRRNHVMRREAFRPAVGAVDCYSTWALFTKDFFTYTQAHLSPQTGKPSVGGYPGPCWVETFNADFDAEDDPARALADTARFLRDLEATYGVPVAATRIHWSGNKGIHLELPASLFGITHPAPDLIDRLKQVAVVLLKDYPTADFSIYEKLRLWRVANTRHSKSGLYKIPLTLEELYVGDVQHIRDLSRSSRYLPEAPTDRSAVAPTLATLFASTAISKPGHRPQRLSNRPRGWVAPTLRGLAQGGRNVDLHAIAGRLRRAGFTVDDAYVLLAPHAERSGLDLDELQRLCRSAARYVGPAPDARQGGPVHVA